MILVKVLVNSSLSPKVIYEAGRGWWRLAKDAERERLALIIVDGQVRVSVAIESWETREDGRRAFNGTILAVGDPVHDRFVGKPDPSNNKSRNPIRLWPVKDVRGQYKLCACGCGKETKKEWVPGHDQKAIHDRIRRDFGGNVTEFINWYDGKQCK